MRTKSATWLGFFVSMWWNPHTLLLVFEYPPALGLVFGGWKFNFFSGRVWGTLGVDLSLVFLCTLSSLDSHWHDDVISWFSLAVDIGLMTFAVHGLWLGQWLFAAWVEMTLCCLGRVGAYISHAKATGIVMTVLLLGATVLAHTCDTTSATAIWQCKWTLTHNFLLIIPALSHNRDNQSNYYIHWDLYS